MFQTVLSLDFGDDNASHRRTTFPIRPINKLLQSKASPSKKLAGPLAELAFFCLASCAMLSTVMMSKESRNYAVTGLLEGMAGTDALCQLTEQLASTHRTPT